MTDSIRRISSTSSASPWDPTAHSSSSLKRTERLDSLSSCEEESAPLKGTGSACDRPFLKDVMAYLGALVNRCVRACTKFKNDLRSLRKEPLNMQQELRGSQEEVKAIAELRSYRALSPSSVDLITAEQAKTQGFSCCSGNKVLSREIDLPASASTDLLVVPIVMKGKESAVFVVDFENQCIEFYDPEGRSSEECAEARSLRNHLACTYPELVNQCTENRTPHTKDSYSSALYVYEFIGARSVNSFERACHLNAQLTQNDIEGPVRSSLLRRFIAAYIPAPEALPGFEV